MKAEYSLPVKVKIEAEHPDQIMVEVARAMYDAVAEYVKSPGFDERVRMFDMEYSIYVKADEETFGKG